MKTRLMFFVSLALSAICGAAFAQEAVVGVADPDSLFTSADPHLNANKQAAYHIMKDLLEANHWEQADKWLKESRPRLRVENLLAEKVP